MNTTIDMTKVREALARYGRRVSKSKTTYGPPPPPTDAALRKPLKNHGAVCRSGYNHPHFLH